MGFECLITGMAQFIEQCLVGIKYFLVKRGDQNTIAARLEDVPEIRLTFQQCPSTLIPFGNVFLDGNEINYFALQTPNGCNDRGFIIFLSILLPVYQFAPPDPSRRNGIPELLVNFQGS